MSRPLLFALSILLAAPYAPVHAQEREISLGELLARLPGLFQEDVKVAGELTGWGDMAALDSAATREVMVDLRTLPEALRQQINDTCTLEHHCAATVVGTVVHIRGPGISELGVEARDIDFEAQTESDAGYLVCEYDAEMASVLCVIEAGPVQIEDIAINGGACRVWDHRLVRSTLAPRLREAGAIASEGEYSDGDLDLLSAEIVRELTERDFVEGDFFRLETYRCTIESVNIETDAGPFDFRTQR